MTDSVSHVYANLQDTIARMALKLDEIRRLHRRFEIDGEAYCAHCPDYRNEDSAPWPCETMRIVERVAL